MALEGAFSYDVSSSLKYSKEKKSYSQGYKGYRLEVEPGC